MQRLTINTAVTVLLPKMLFSWADSKTLLSDALGGNSNLNVALLKCTLSKGTTQSTLTLSKSGGDNNFNLVSGGMATLTLTTGNTDTQGPLLISLENATAGSEIVFPVSFEFYVGNDQVDLSNAAKADVNAQCDIAVSDAALATAANLALVKAKTDNLPADPASNTQVNTRLAASSYTAPDNASISAIKTKTDNLPASPAAVGSAMTLTSAYDSAKTAAQAGNQMALTAEAITAVQAGLAKTSELPSVAGLATEANATANKNTIVQAISDKPVTPATDLTGIATTQNVATVLAAVNEIEPGGDATAANQQTILAAIANIPTKPDKPSIEG